MGRHKLTLVCAREMDCPKEVVMWNYYDHEHLIGTHYKYYNYAKIVAQRDDWSLVLRRKKMPLLPFYTSGLGLQYMMEPNVMRTIHKDSNGFVLDMTVRFDDLPEERCLVTVTYNMEVSWILKIFEFFFKKLFYKWFDEVWKEDATMRLRRWRVYKLGFRDFYGIDYINNRSKKPDQVKYDKYEFKPPIKTFSAIEAENGEYRPFSSSVELGYNE